MLMSMQKKSAGFALMGIVIGITVIGVALGMVSVARQKRERVKRQVQKSVERAEQESVKAEEETVDTSKQDAPRSEKPDTDRHHICML